MKFPSSSSCPRIAMPWRARNHMLRRICSSCFRLTAFSLVCPADSVSPTSCVVVGRVTSRTTASLWHSLPSSFQNFSGPCFPVGEAVTDEAAVHLCVAYHARLLGRHAEMAERMFRALNE
ncbi:hypothetical protein DPMN_092307 [Dreissena polymorpha]|uniref:Uncharacterized protein n=1 Tax=Dreissena polymorpha TaxID=45954 RepID=A0A9D4L210_DREPO|nr:hypothetical protein DPMN_092307 [Dreissena polymorpha]